MHRRHRHGVATSRPTWPGRNARHAGLLDFGLLGGASFDPDKQSWTFARDMQDFIYCRTSPLTQMSPRIRPWEPRMIEEWGAHPGAMEYKPINQSINDHIRYLGANFESDHLDDVDILYGLVHDSRQQEYSLAYYDPFMGNACAVGRFADLPVVVTPGGRTGSDITITLVQHKSSIKPPLNFLAPRATLLSFVSPVCQVATPSSTSRAGKPEEQFLVRTKECITVLVPSESVPTMISRIEPAFVQVAARISTRPSSCKDRTIHAAISPYSSNMYALLGDKGRIAIWSRSSAHSLNFASHGQMDEDDDLDETGRYVGLQPSLSESSKASGSSGISIVRTEDPALSKNDDPWRSCAWGAHPSQLVVASRKMVELIDFRGKATQTCLFSPRIGETIRAIQEDEALQLAPFQTYIATSHQIACMDQRYAKRPVLSWAHQADRAMPCGVKAMDLTSNGGNYSTILTWNQRDAEIVTYNVSVGSNGQKPEPMVMKGRAQALPSFHSHAHYTNSSSLRDPWKRWQYKAGPDETLQQSVKPPLMGLGVLPEFDYDAGQEDEEGEPDERRERDPLKARVNVAKFSLVQYAYTGALYAQEIEVMTKQAADTEENAARRDSILTADHNEDWDLDSASANKLSSLIAKELMTKESLGEDEMIDSIFEAAETNVAKWKAGAKKDQDKADKESVNQEELHSHVDLDLHSLLDTLRTKLFMDQDAETNHDSIDLRAKVDAAMEVINSSAGSMTMYEILQAVKCVGLPSSERSALVQFIQDTIEVEPFSTTDMGEITHRQIRKSWPKLNRKIDPLIQRSEPSVDIIAAFLQEMYPLPESCLLEPDQKRRDEDALTNQLAHLSIPAGGRDVEHMSNMIDLELDVRKEDEGDLWPTVESQLIRSRTIRRVAQDLLLNSTVVIKSVEPDTTSAQQEGGANPTFQYLFQNPRGVSNAPKLELSSQSKPVLGEWILGENPSTYVYTLPEAAANSISAVEEEVVDEEEVREREERMLELRRKRERRAEKRKSARQNDPYFGAESESQPGAGYGADERREFGALYDNVDEDGFFSLPVVVSASQPASLLKSRSMLRSQQHSQQQLQLPKVPPRQTPTPKKPVLFASQPAALAPRPSPNGTALSLDRPLFSPTSFFDIEDRQGTLPSLKDIIEVSQSQEISSSQEQSQQRSSVSQEGSRQSLSLDSAAGRGVGARGHLWGASQPVRGAFATRKPPMGPGFGAVAGNNKAKKKKPRTQGF